MLQIMQSSLSAGLRIVIYTLDWCSRIWWGHIIKDVSKCANV